MRRPAWSITSPVLCSSSPPSTFMSVDLPEPLAPINP